MNFISEDFYLQYLDSYTLCIQSDTNNDHLVVVDKDNEVLVYLRHEYLNPSSEVTKFLSYPFINVIAVLSPQNIIWVPKEVYSESDMSLYSTYFLDENIDNILVSYVQSLNAYALYQYDLTIVNRWKKMFSDVRFVPSFQIMINQLTALVSNTGTVLSVEVHENRLDLMLFINGDFKLFNTFEVTTVDDLSYFVLSIAKNFSLTDKFEKVLLSNSSIESEWAQCLKKYAKEISVLQPNNSWVVNNSEIIKSLEVLNILADTKSCV